MTHTGIQSKLESWFAGAISEAIAIRSSDRAMTWSELEYRSRALAFAIGTADLGPSARLAVVTQDRAAMIVAMLGVLRAGGVFVPLDLAYPEAHLRALVRTARPDAIVIDETISGVQLERIGAAGMRQFSLPDTIRGPGANAVLAPQETGPDDPAYIYFTSGTTGEPKGVLGRSGGLSHFIEWEVEEFQLPPGLVGTQLTSPGHDPFLRDVLVPLSVGGQIVIPKDRNTILVPHEFRLWLNQSGAALTHLTPTIFRNLCSAHLTDRDFPELNWVLIGGEKLKGADLCDWFARFKDRVTLANLYGPTETTLAKFVRRITVEDTRQPVVGIGRPIPGTRYTILDAEGAPACPGTIGELEIITPHASLGYFGDLEAGGFREVSDDGAVVYRTGDFVVEADDGSVEFVERRDRQIKLYGERIELAEIEAALLDGSSVRSCLVAVSQNCSGADELLCFYISLDGDMSADLVAAATDRLSPACRPRKFVRVDAFPLTMNGKIDVAALLRCLLAKPTTGETGVGNEEPGDLYQRLLDIWRRILSRDDIDASDVFMEIGGDSLTIMQLITQIEEDFGYELTLWDVFEDLTIEKLADKIIEAP